MADLLCTDNRFEMIEKYKKALIEATNIETDTDEMKVIDNVLFRFWQMGWLEKLETTDAVEVVRCKDCVWYDERRQGGHFCECRNLEGIFPPDFFCKDGERRDDAEIH